MKIDWEEVCNTAMGIMGLAVAIAMGGAGIGLLLGSMYTVLSWFGML